MLHRGCENPALTFLADRHIPYPSPPFCSHTRGKDRYTVPMVLLEGELELFSVHKLCVRIHPLLYLLSVHELQCTFHS